MIMDSLTSIVEYGKFYYPAFKHYDRITTVQCDKCGKSPLKASIGFGGQDLCLLCAHSILENQIEPKEVCALMEQSQFKPSSNTKMEQAQFKPSERRQVQVCTLMEQAQFKLASSSSASNTRMEQAQFKPSFGFSGSSTGSSSSSSSSSSSPCNTRMEQAQFRSRSATDDTSWFLKDNYDVE